MTLDELYEQSSAEIGGPAIGAWPTRAGDRIKPHKGGGGGSSTTKQEIPSELKPLATAYANKAMDLANQPYQAYGGQRFAQLNKAQNNGIMNTAIRAMVGSGTINNAESKLNQIISGGKTNPYLDQMVKKAQGSVRSQFNTGAVNSGSFGNSGLQEQFADSLGNVAAQMYGQAYDQDRARQMQGIGMAQQFGNQAYIDAEQMMKVGQMQQDQEQQSRDFAYQQFKERQDLPYKQLAAMSGVFGSNLGASSVTKSSGGGK